MVGMPFTLQPCYACVWHVQHDGWAGLRPPRGSLSGRKPCHRARGCCRLSWCSCFAAQAVQATHCTYTEKKGGLVLQGPSRIHFTGKLASEQSVCDTRKIIVSVIKDTLEVFMQHGPSKCELAKRVLRFWGSRTADVCRIIDSSLPMRVIATTSACWCSAAVRLYL